MLAPPKAIGRLSFGHSGVGYRSEFILIQWYPTSDRHFDIAIPLSHRWRHLELRIMPGASWRVLRKIPKDALPCLEALTLHHEGGHWGYDGDHFGDIFQSASGLRGVDIWGMASDPMVMNLPWSQLTRFACDSFLTAVSCYKLLTHLPNLQSGHFEIWWYEMSPILQGPLTLAKFEHLALRIASRIVELLANLVLPTLQYLGIDFIRADDWSHPHFMTFIAPFSLRLHTLHLYCPPMTDGDVIVCLRNLPSLVVLALRDRSVSGCLTDSVLDLLAYGESSYLCPRLEDVRLEGVKFCSDGSIVKMVESRWRLEVPIRNFGFSVSSKHILSIFAYNILLQSSVISLHSYTSPEATPTTSQHQLQIPTQLTRFGLSLARDGSEDLYSQLDKLRDDGLSLVYEKPDSA